MLYSNRRPQRRRPPAERPTPHWFTLGSLRSFGSRLWNPPPPSREEHYVWFVKPNYAVLLEDVVADKHLPPISRLDFEEYLYYAEDSLKNLYFYEWVQYYHQLFDDWTQSVLPTTGTGLPGSSKGGYRPRELRERLKNCQDPRLRKEFAFAKDTFFRPGASMQLNIPREYIDRILLIPNDPPSYDEEELTTKMPSFPNQPEPSIFDPILDIVYNALNMSFSHFVRLAFCNAGLWHCVPGGIGGALILAGGLVMWSRGMMSHKRGYVVGGLPLIWVGLWFMLVTLSGHCLTVYVTGDARQLYPWEMERPLPPGVVPPPIYSLTPAPAPDAVAPIPLHLPDIQTSVTRRSLPIHQHNHQSRGLEGRRWSEGVLKLLVGAEDDDKSRNLHALDSETGLVNFNRLPPARKTKDIPRNLLAMNVGQTNTLGEIIHPSILTPSLKGSVPGLSQRRDAVIDLSMGLTAMGLGAERRPDSLLSEENDFGIVLSEAFEEDEIPEVHHFSNKSQPYLPAILKHDEGPAMQRSSFSTRALDDRRQVALVQPPEHAVKRRQTMSDLLLPIVPNRYHEGCSLNIDITTRRGSKSSETERESRPYWPWARKLYGPMTLVHSPLVRRAHWVTTWRTAAISTVVTFGLTLGLIR